MFCKSQVEREHTRNFRCGWAIPQVAPELARFRLSRTLAVMIRRMYGTVQWAIHSGILSKTRVLAMTPPYRGATHSAAAIFH